MSRLTRRRFLYAIGLAGAAASIPACFGGALTVTNVFFTEFVVQ